MAEEFVSRLTVVSDAALKRRFRLQDDKASELMNLLERSGIVTKTDDFGVRSIQKRQNVCKLAVFIGRFQPFHFGHLSVIQQALDMAPNVVILLGSANKPLSMKNPWTVAEREQMIRQCFESKINERIKCLPLDDTSDNKSWVDIVKNLVMGVGSEISGKLLDRNISLIGHNKDVSSYYLNLFPEWKLVEVANHRTISATDIRDRIFGDEGINAVQLLVEDGILPRSVGEFLKDSLADKECLKTIANEVGNNHSQFNL